MVYVFLADGFEEIEALAPVDLLRRAGIDVCMVGIGGPLLKGSHSIQVKADIPENEFKIEKAEMLILPGGPGHEVLKQSDTVKKALFEATDRKIPIGAICAAPSILGEFGLLDGKKAVCFPGFESSLTGATVLEDPVVTDGTITTARGAGCAFPFGFELIRVLRGEKASSEIRETIQYDAF